MFYIIVCSCSLDGLITILQEVLQFGPDFFLTKLTRNPLCHRQPGKHSFICIVVSSIVNKHYLQRNARQHDGNAFLFGPVASVIVN